MTRIRKHRFTLAGGHPALNFINTVHDWTATELLDYLEEFADAIRFGELAGLLTAAEGLQLRRGKSQVEFERLRDLRALLRRIFEMRLSGQAPRNRDLGKLSAGLGEAARATRLVAPIRTHGSRPPAMRREITATAAGDALLRLRIVEGAVALLVSGAMARVKSCPACGWFFLDVSKNQSRRWCSMDTCGAVAKARRYYRRLKEREDR